MLMRHHEHTHELESKQQKSVHFLREDHINRQHSTELNNQEEYMKRAQRELKKKHALELKQQPKSLKQKELMIRKQFRDTCKIQTRQYKALKTQVLQTTSKEEQKTIIRKLKEEQRRKMALLGEQYEQTIADMLQKQSVIMLSTLLHASNILFLLKKVCKRRPWKAGKGILFLQKHAKKQLFFCWFDAITKVKSILHIFSVCVSRSAWMNRKNVKLPA